jgi:hypothetical protein
VHPHVADQPVDDAVSHDGLEGCSRTPRMRSWSTTTGPATMRWTTSACRPGLSKRWRRVELGEGRLARQRRLDRRRPPDAHVIGIDLDKARQVAAL